MNSVDVSYYPLNNDANGLSVGVAITVVVASDVALEAAVVFVYC